MRGGADDHPSQSRLFYDLCAIVLTILDSPELHLPFLPSCLSSALALVSSSAPRPRSGPPSKLTPTDLATLLLGLSLTLMLSGSVTFVLGFILMPWVLGFVLLLYFLGLVSHISQLGRYILMPPLPMPSPPIPRSPKQMSELGTKKEEEGRSLQFSTVPNKPPNPNPITHLSPSKLNF